MSFITLISGLLSATTSMMLIGVAIDLLRRTQWRPSADAFRPGPRPAGRSPAGRRAASRGALELGRMGEAGEDSVIAKSYKILIVDDEPNIRTVFRAALEADDCLVAACEDGETALRRLRHFPTDLVLLDLQMPGANGMEILRRLRDQGSFVPVLIVTAHGGISDAVAAMKLGAIDFLSKPLTPDALRRTVRGILQRPDAADQAGSHAHGDRATHLLGCAKRSFNERLFERASMFLGAAIRENPGMAEPWYLSGLLHEAQLQHRLAREDYEAALRLDPDHPLARARLRDLSVL